MTDHRFRDIWMYCMLIHKNATMVSGPCMECVRRYTVSGPPSLDLVAPKGKCK